MTDYGQDVSTYPGLDPSGRNITGGRAIAECAARRLMTAPGLLSYTDDDDCIDLRQSLSAQVKPSTLFALGSVIEGVVERDERVISATAEVTQVGDGLKITVQIEPSEGPTFTLVLATTAISVQIVSLSEF